MAPRHSVPAVPWVAISKMIISGFVSFRGEDSSGASGLPNEIIGFCSTRGAINVSGRMLQLVDAVGGDPLLLEVVSSAVEMSLRRTGPNRRGDCGYNSKNIFW